MGSKILVWSLSIMLAVGVGMGDVKEALCGPTTYKDACMQTIGSANGTNPKDLIKATVDVIATKVKNSVDVAQSLLGSVTNPTIKGVLENCHLWNEKAQERLDRLIQAVKESDLSKLGEHAGQIQNWLNPIISNMATCIDEMDDGPDKDKMEKVSTEVSQLVDNALAIFGKLPDVLQAFDIKLNLSSFLPGRRLLESDATEEFPSWLSAADRKLMGRALEGHGRAANNAGLVPNAVVAQDGSGQYKTLSAALDAYPKGHQGRYIVYVKAGVYREHYVVTKEKVNIYIYGDGARRSIITGDKSVIKSGLRTSGTATIAVEANGFIARNIGFQNTAGPDGEQAVALRVNADMCAFFSVRIDGYQDSLYIQSGPQFYRNCVISGTIDFIFGDSSTVIQNSLIIVRKGRKGGQNTVTAPGNTEPHETTATVIHNCRIVPEQLLVPDRFTVKSFLGRPWKKYAKSIIMESMIADFIQPAGYMPWNGDDTGYFGEYNNRGPGADTKGRVTWKGFHRMTKAEALPYTVGTYLSPWVKSTGIRYIPGLVRP